MSTAALTKPDDGSTFYGDCQRLLRRLRKVPSLTTFLDSQQEMCTTGSSYCPFPSGTNPVTTLWNTFRLGSSLCALFNATEPETLLEVDEEATLENLKACKHGVYHFLLACKNQLGMTDENMFTITELYQDDTNKFLKVSHTVELLLQRMVEKGLLEDDTAEEEGEMPPTGANESQSTDPLSSTAQERLRKQTVKELLITERKYVKDLEKLQGYMHELQAQKVVSNDILRNLFANLNGLVDFQRRFLIGVEANAELPPTEQRFGALFIQMENSFTAYEPFCANYTHASEIALAEAPNLMRLAHIVEPTYGLPSLLIKPVQRVCKYPLLLSQLAKLMSPDEPYYQELLDGLVAIKRVADRVNETQRKEENFIELKKLEKIIENWNGPSLSYFGELHMFDKLSATVNDVERECWLYLFDKALLVCKETAASRKANKNGNSKKPLALHNKATLLIREIRAVVPTARNGTYSVKIDWLNSETILSPVNEEQFKLWTSTIEKVRDAYKASRLSKQTGPRHPGLTRAHSNLSELEGHEANWNSDDDAVSFIDQQDDHDDDEVPLSLRRSSSKGILNRSRSQSNPAHVHSMGAGYPPMSMPPLPRVENSYGSQHPGHLSAPAPPSHSSYEQSQAFLGEQFRKLQLANERQGPEKTYLLADQAYRQRRSASSPNIHNHSTNVKVRINYHEDSFMLVVPSDVTFEELLKKVEKKIHLCSGTRIEGRLRIKYKDEENDLILINTDEDVQMAFENRNNMEARQNELAMVVDIYVS
ncbi:RhoGEF-domain-containing protein [Basidiobolus meristosporus CBS 931.73]|uniref:RhoGEF-domain-containing protein n=1 Tax=Basidiobolus meristosporus CBS 931.73 TaxID=1314790 RepID=A0A1Y1ZDZ0_9FUNG|nr:RhoGEF-domain-containing protein [Basidiobolus meristosporus CBS 931.73]|eukprot:ORY08404.1 RhoGEF-domain-containing protein [Basidiobolus meristosporus CBS 931.73]